MEARPIRAAILVAAVVCLALIAHSLPAAGRIQVFARSISCVGPDRRIGQRNLPGGGNLSPRPGD